MESETRQQKILRLREQQIALKKSKKPKPRMSLGRLQELKMQRLVGITPQMKRSYLRGEQEHLRNLTLKRTKKKKKERTFLDLFR